MIKVELGHMGISFDCELNFHSVGAPLWFAELHTGNTSITGKGKSPVLAIEALRSKFHKEEE